MKAKGNGSRLQAVITPVIAGIMVIQGVADDRPERPARPEGERPEREHGRRSWERLPEEKREEIQAICLGHCHPFFNYALPARPLEERRREQHDVTLNFLHFHNEAEKVPPSQETIDKIHLKTLIDIITTTNSLLQPEDVMQTVMTRIHELITCEAWSVLILDENQPDTLRFAPNWSPWLGGRHRTPLR